MSEKKEEKATWCPFMNAQCREDCAFFMKGTPCGLRFDLEELATVIQTAGWDR